MASSTIPPTRPIVSAWLFEPTSGNLVVANAGALTFELRIPGRATHGSSRLAGHSALDAFLPIYDALPELERERNAHPDPLSDGNVLPYPISIGILRAGDWASSAPDLLLAHGRLGVLLTNLRLRHGRLSHKPSPAPALPIPGCATTRSNSPGRAANSPADASTPTTPWCTR